MLIAFNKPYGVLSQFTTDGSSNAPLSAFRLPPGVYPLGRLDADSEGLLLLSDEPGLNTRLLHPRNLHGREYWAQVERIPSLEELRRLSTGLVLKDHVCLPCKTWLLSPQPEIPERKPAIRFRKTVPTCWIALEMREGKNRQVRRMTAAIGHPTLRLLRVRIGQFRMEALAPGEWKVLGPVERQDALAGD
jgi:23S rRNA pseudouridine2457 synthase